MQPPNLDFKKGPESKHFLASLNAKFSFKVACKLQKSYIGLFINLYLKKAPHEAFLAHQMQNFLRQADVQPPKSLSIFILLD